MTKVSEQDELLLQRITELNIQNETLTKQLKIARGNICESCVGTTEQIESMSYELEEASKLIEQQGGVLETYRKRLNAFEYESRLDESYSDKVIQ